MENNETTDPLKQLSNDVAKKVIDREDSDTFKFLKDLEQQKLSEKTETIGVSVPYIKDPEELLENGTIVIVEGETIKRIIESSMPSDKYNHRYKVSDYSFICEKHDFSLIEQKAQEE